MEGRVHEHKIGKKGLYSCALTELTIQVKPWNEASQMSSNNWQINKSDGWSKESAQLRSCLVIWGLNLLQMRWCSNALCHEVPIMANLLPSRNWNYKLARIRLQRISRVVCVPENNYSLLMSTLLGNGWLFTKEDKNEMKELKAENRRKLPPSERELSSISWP